MPLAQNYKDDVSLLESEAAFTNVTMGHANVGLGTRQGTNSKPNVSEYFFRQMNNRAILRSLLCADNKKLHFPN